MIKEAYCSVEIAKLLKEKGFDVQTHAFYNPNKSYAFKFDTCLIDRNAGIYVSAPTHQIAIAWLREEKNIFIVIEPHIYDYINEKNKSYVCSLWVGDNYYEYIESRDYHSYEEAVEAALKYVLEKLI